MSLARIRLDRRFSRPAPILGRRPPCPLIIERTSRYGWGLFIKVQNCVKQKEAQGTVHWTADSLCFSARVSALGGLPDIAPGMTYRCRMFSTGGGCPGCTGTGYSRAFLRVPGSSAMTRAATTSTVLRSMAIFSGLRSSPSLISVFFLAFSINSARFSLNSRLCRKP